MTDDEKLKRDPAVILRRAATHLRKRWEGHQGMNGRHNMRLIASAIQRVQECRLNILLNSLRGRR